MYVCGLWTSGGGCWQAGVSYVNYKHIYTLKGCGGGDKGKWRIMELCVGGKEVMVGHERYEPWRVIGGVRLVEGDRVEM